MSVGSTDFRMQHFTIRELMDRIESNQLKYNRIRGREWSIIEQIRFIESILCGIPIASIYLNGSQPQWTVLDGVERLYTIYCYISGNLSLNNLELLPNNYGGYFFELPSQIKRRILNTSVWGYVLTTEISKKTLNSIYKRLNKIDYSYD